MFKTINCSYVIAIGNVASSNFDNCSRFDSDDFHFDKVVTASIADINRFDSDVFHFDSFAPTDKSNKTRVAKGVAIHRTKASTFALEKNAKELVFFPSHTPTFVQLDRFLNPLPQKN